jgi:hypothetical protein
MSDAEKQEPIEGEVVNPTTPVQFTKTKHDEQIVELLEAAFHNAFNITEACQYAGISRETFYNWLADDDIFSYRMSVAQGAPNKKAKEIIIQAIQAGDPQLALRFLMLRDPDFKPKVEAGGDQAAAEARNNLKGVLDAIGSYDPSSAPAAPPQPDDSRLVENDPTDIS